MVVEHGPADALARRTLEHLVAGTSAQELTGDGGGPLFAVETEHAISRVRVFEAPGVRLVSTFMSAKGRVHDTHGVFGFTAPDSAVPHFSLDCSDRANDEHAFHLDLLPRVELAAAIPYLDEVYAPLDAPFSAAAEVEGLGSGTGTPRRRALMSPWLLVHPATAGAIVAVEPVVTAYADHWLGLVDKGISDEALAAVAASGTDLAARDRLVRTALFSPAGEPVWKRVEHMLGVDSTRAMQSAILGLA